MERIERTALKNLIYNEQYCRKVLPFIKEEYFTDRLEKLLFTEIIDKNPNNESPSFNVTFGVIPSYGSQKVGMEIDGISRKGGPADKAGMKKGDVIIAINRKKVRNIYDYMARLADLKNGDKIIVKIIRDTEEMELILEL